MLKMRWIMSYGFVANFVGFSAVQKFENRLRFDKVKDSLMVRTFLRHSIVLLAMAVFSVCPLCFGCI